MPLLPTAPAGAALGAATPRACVILLASDMVEQTEQKHTPLSASCGGALPSSRSALATPLPSVRARPRLSPASKKQANAPPVLRVFYTEPPSVKIRSAGSAADKALFYKRFQPKKNRKSPKFPRAHIKAKIAGSGSIERVAGRDGGDGKGGVQEGPRRNGGTRVASRGGEASAERGGTKPTSPRTGS